jgi:hypothetical protein
MKEEAEGRMESKWRQVEGMADRTGVEQWWSVEQSQTRT